MNNLDIKKISESLQNKILLGIEFYDKSNDGEDSCLELTFSESYKLIIQTFCRIYDDERIYAMDSERYLLPNYEAPESDYQNLPFKNSLLSKDLEIVREKCLNAIVKNVRISETNDIYVELNNAFTIQGIIHCRCKSYLYYGLFCNGHDVVKCCIDWENY